MYIYISNTSNFLCLFLPIKGDPGGLAPLPGLPLPVELKGFPDPTIRVMDPTGEPIWGEPKEPVPNDLYISRREENYVSVKIMNIRC